MEARCGTVGLSKVESHSLHFSWFQNSGGLLRTCTRRVYLRTDSRLATCFPRHDTGPRVSTERPKTSGKLGTATVRPTEEKKEEMGLGFAKSMGDGSVASHTTGNWSRRNFGSAERGIGRGVDL